MRPSRGPVLRIADSSTDRALDGLVQLLASIEAIEFRRWGDLGLTVSQLRVLHRLLERPASCGQVADHLGITPSTATAIIERLVRRELIERIPHAGDRRVTDLRLSTRGSELLAEASQRKRGVIVAALAELSEEDRRQLASLLDRLAAAVQDREDESAMDDEEPPDPAAAGAKPHLRVRD